jgi:hypothetical protein
MGDDDRETRAAVSDQGDDFPWFPVLVVFTVLGLLSTVAVISTQRLEQAPVRFWPSIAAAMPTWWFWALAAKPIVRLSRRFPLVAGAWRRHWPVHAGTALALLLLQTTITVAVYRTLWPGDTGGRPWSFWVAGYLANRGLGSLIVYGGLVGLAHTMEARRRLRRREVDAARLEAELARAQLGALQLQLQPHFLFNTLHAVGVLNQEDPARATRMIASLGDLLRASLATRATQEIPLERELQLLRHYLDIEAIRFSDRVEIAVQVEPGIGHHLVPTFVLQPLVENAVRHGVAVNPGSTPIRISARSEGGELVLSVWNGGGSIAGAEVKDGVGLATTRDRLSRLYGAGGRLELADRDGGVLAVARVPLHDRPVL